MSLEKIVCPPSDGTKNHQIPSLSDDIMFEIFLRLDVDSLLRLRCVSKSFKGLIDNPVFVKNHLKRCKPLKSDFELIFYKGDLPLLSVDINVNTKIAKTRKLVCPATNDGSEILLGIVSCCDGIVCLRDGYQMPEIYTLWNPSTGKCKKTEPLTTKPPRKAITGEWEGQTRDGRKVISAFGYDHVNDDYKIVRMTPFTRGRLNKLQVYSLRDNVWKRYNKKLPKGSCCEGRAVFVQGSVHWIWLAGESYNIVAFDLGTEEFRMIPLPENLRNYQQGSSRELKEFNDDLCVVAKYSYTTNVETRFTLWAMEEYGNQNSWRQILNFKDSCESVVCLPNSGGRFLTSWLVGYRWTLVDRESIITNVIFESAKDSNTREDCSAKEQEDGSKNILADWFKVHLNLKSLVQL